MQMRGNARQTNLFSSLDAPRTGQPNYSKFETSPGRFALKHFSWLPLGLLIHKKLGNPILILILILIIRNRKLILLASFYM